MIIEPDDDNISLKSIKECSICLELLNDETLKQLECSHIFHINCIDMWAETKNSCPLCRYVVPKPNYFPNYLENNLENNLPIQRRTSNKYLYNTLTFIIIIYHFSSIFYNAHVIYNTNYVINSIIINKNTTELGEHSNTTLVSFYFVFSNIIYSFFFLILYIFINNKRLPSILCNVIIFYTIIIINIIIIDSYNKNTYKYLDIESLEFDDKYKKTLILSIILLGTSYGFVILLSFYSICIK